MNAPPSYKPTFLDRQFRRPIERHPGSTAAKHARMALANLKDDLLNDQRSS